MPAEALWAFVGAAAGAQRDTRRETRRTRPMLDLGFRAGERHSCGRTRARRLRRCRIAQAGR